MTCHSCGRGFHDECLIGCKRCHEDEEEIELDFLKEETALVPNKKKELKDPISTGRKRAALLYPLDRDAPCEWKGLKNCGGGRRPIIGCMDGKQEHRHHGPVKKPTYNREGNVHRICTTDHVRWHELNDLIYDEGDYNLLPHQPEPATGQEIIDNEMKWRSGKMKEEFELKSSVNNRKVLEEVESHAD